MASAEVQSVQTLLQDQPLAKDQNEVQALVEYIASRPEGLSNLEHLTKLIPPSAPAVNFATTRVASVGEPNGWQASTSVAGGTMINFWFYQHIMIPIKAPVRRQATINMAGLAPGLPGGALFGTLWYDTLDDLSGSFEVIMTSIGPYMALYFRRGGRLICMFQAGNVGAVVGVSGGKGSWE